LITLIPFIPMTRSIIPWLAHRRQKPGDKINHALVLGGAPGIGKDTLLEPVKISVGPWNFHEIAPKNVSGRFNGFIKSVILRISEVRDLGDFDRFTFYEAMKTYTAAPPDVLRVDEKHLREHPVLNCCGVVMTTNYKTDGIYLPADDRRHYIAWSEKQREDFPQSYWDELWKWYENGGFEHVAAYLDTLDLSGFNSKAPPAKTQAFWDIVDSNRNPEEAEIADILDEIGNPDAFTLKQIMARSNGTDIGMWLAERKNRRTIPHRLEKCGYVPFRNDTAKDGYWVIRGSRQPVYVRKGMAEKDARIAIRDLTDGDTNRWNR
jgi:hypothetical protein